MRIPIVIPLKNGSTRFVVVTVLERCYGPRRLHRVDDDDDDDDDNDNGPM